MIHSQDGAHMMSRGDGEEDGFASVAVGEDAGDVVGGGLRFSEGGDVGVAGEGEDLFGEEGEGGLLLADHAADEGVDDDEQGELGGVLAQSEAGWVDHVGILNYSTN